MSLIGVFVGLGIGDVNKGTENYLMAFIAGNFIYIAADIWRNLFKHKSKLNNFL